MTGRIDELTRALLEIVDASRPLTLGQAITGKRSEPTRLTRQKAQMVAALSTEKKLRIAGFGYERALLRQAREKQLHDSVVGWRLYWMHRGRLCPALVGALQPVAKISIAACPPPPGVNLVASTALGCAAETIPTTDCLCGLRLCATVDALSLIARAMCLRPEDTPAIIAATTAVGIDNLDDWDMPVPALVRVRGESAVLDERQYRAEQYLTTNPAGRFLARSGRVQNADQIISECAGTYRARKLTIIGPVLTGPVPNGTPDVRDLEQRYQVRHADARDLITRDHDDDGHPIGFGHVFRLAADGQLPAWLMEPYA